MGGIGFDMKIVGLKEVAQKMKPETVQKPIMAALDKIRMFLGAEIKKATPVSDNRLRSSISSAINGQTVKIGTTVKYASYVEYGTRPHWPPIAAITPWAEKHGIPPFLVARAIALHGTKGAGMFKKGLEKLNERLSSFIKDIGEAIEVQFK